jgi:hypothetical protein
MYAGAIVLLLLAGTGILVGATLRLPTTAEAALAVYVVAFAEMVGLCLFLSPFGEVTHAALIAGSAAVFAAAVSTWVLLGTPRLPRPPRLSTAVMLRHPTMLVLALVVGLALAYVVALIFGTPPNGWDPLNYHLARAAFWLQSGRIG